MQTKVLALLLTPLALYAGDLPRSRAEPFAAKTLAAGWTHSVAIRDGRVWTWGDNAYGQLGQPDAGRALRPRPVAGLDGVTAVSAAWHTLAVTRDGHVYAWGRNDSGQLGNGRFGIGEKTYEPVRVDGLEGIVAVAAGWDHSLALARDGTVYAWGCRSHGQLGDGVRKAGAPVARPQAVPGLAQITMIAAGGQHSLALGKDGTVYAWGSNWNGQLGNGKIGKGTHRAMPQAAIGPDGKGSLTGAVSIAAGALHSVAVAADGMVYAWGYNGTGQVPEGSRTGFWWQTKGKRNLGAPTAALVTGKPAKTFNNGLAAAAGFEATYVLDKDGHVYSAGWSMYGEQASGGAGIRINNRDVLCPVAAGRAVTGHNPPPGVWQLSGVVEIAGGMHHAVALDRDGAIWAWGHNGFGQVGDGSVYDGTVAQRLADFDAKAAALPRQREVRQKSDNQPPNGNCINVRERGAKGDGIALDQETLQRVIDDCAQNGGGTVWLPPGYYLTGTLFMRDNVRLHLSAGATILAVTNRDYFTGKALIQADGVSGIAITGAGVIDARGAFVGARDWRHHCLYMTNCRDVLLEGVSTINSGSWTQYYLRCIGLTIRGVTVRSLLPGRNNDGIDLSGCENVRIEKCTVVSDDDAIVIKSHTGDQENRNIEIVDNVCHTYCGAFKLGTETRGAYSNVVCRNLTCYGAKAMELYSVDGSEVQDIRVENVRAYDALVAINIRLGARLRKEYWIKGLEPKVGFLRNISIRNVTGNTAARAWRGLLLEHNITDGEWAVGHTTERAHDSCISGLPEHFVENVKIEQVDVRVPGGAETVPDAATRPELPDAYPAAGNFGMLPAHGIFVRHARDVTIRKTRFKTDSPDVRPPFAAHNAPGFNVEWANLLVNGGFEDELTPAWERRTPDSAARKIWRATGEGRSGAAAVLENVEPVQTRLRQGHDRSIKIEPGSRIELSAWVKSAMDAAGETSLQIYCMDEKGGIVSQPIAVGPGGSFDWTRFSLRTVVPEGTAYVMAYLQINQGVGKAWFDDAALTVRQPPEPLPPAPTVVLFSDLPDDHATIKNAKILLGAGLVKATGAPNAALANAAGALALYDGAFPSEVWLALKGFAEKGGRVFMDMRCFAAALGSAAVAVKVGDPAVKNLQAQMQAGLKVVREDDATAGFATGQVMPRMGWTDGKLLVLPQGFRAEGLEVLAEGPGGEPGLVKLAIGKGRVTACDLLSLREPFYRNVDAYYAFTPVSGALGNPASFGQYYPKKMSYDGVVAEMRQLAEKYPAISIEDEGEASGGYRLWSLNLGTPGKPFYFLYSSAHGSEWEPGYGLMTFARRIAEGRMRDAVDLSAVRIKIIPLINPSGYDKRQRQNANGVDLNRQGDYRWERYKGRDSNNDGAYGPFDYDWKGAAPFTEPEAVAYKRIISDPTLHCILDFHGNTSVKANKFGILPVTAHPDNEDRALAMQRIANLRLRGRHLLRQNDEKEPSQYLLDVIRPNSGIPGLMNNGAAGRFGFLIEMTCGYGESYGTVLQTDFVCEMCRALFIAYR